MATFVHCLAVAETPWRRFRAEIFLGPRELLPEKPVSLPTFELPSVLWKATRGIPFWNQKGGSPHLSKASVSVSCKTRSKRPSLATQLFCGKAGCPFPLPRLLLVASSTDALIFYTDGNFTVTGPNATAHIFATYPQEYLSLTNGFADQVRSRRAAWEGVPLFLLWEQL